jgi:hypothetical protein
VIHPGMKTLRVIHPGMKTFDDRETIRTKTSIRCVTSLFSEQQDVDVDVDCI